jgi:DNA-binding MarR family transcriptional regulator
MAARRKQAVRGGPALGVRLEQVAQRLAARREAALRPLGVGRSQVQQLEEVAAAPGISTAELARRVGLAAQSVASSVASLETRGWLRRVPHPIHRRLVELTLTPAGRRILWRARRALGRTEAAAVAGLSSAKRKALAVLLGEWEATLGE